MAYMKRDGGLTGQSRLLWQKAIWTSWRLLSMVSTILWRLLVLRLLQITLSAYIDWYPRSYFVSTEMRQDVRQRARHWIQCLFFCRMVGVQRFCFCQMAKIQTHQYAKMVKTDLKSVCVRLPPLRTFSTVNWKLVSICLRQKVRRH